MFVEERVEFGLVFGFELVASTQQQEPGSEHLGVVGGFGAFGFAATGVTAHRYESGCEPSDDTEPIQHVSGVGPTGCH